MLPLTSSAFGQQVHDHLALLAVYCYLRDRHPQIGVGITHIGFVADDAFDLDPALVVVVSQVAFIETSRRDTS